MTTQHRMMLLGLIALLMLAACGTRAAGEIVNETITDVQLIREMQYRDGTTEGPLYAVSLDLPDEWVGTFETNATANRIDFEFVQAPDAEELEDDEDAEPKRAYIFSIEALSREQYWQQIGSYPGAFFNIHFTADTYFIYTVPRFAFYSGLEEDLFEALTSAVPQIVASFDAERLNN